MSRRFAAIAAPLAAGLALALAPAGASAELSEAVNHNLSAKPGPQAGAALALVPGNPDRGAAATADPPRPPLAYVSDAGFQPGLVAVRAFPTRAAGGDGVLTPINPCCAPALAAGPEGTIWIAAQTAEGRIAVARIAAGGTAFTAAATLLPTPDGTAAADPALAVGPNGVLAAAWIAAGGSDRRVALSLCAAGGDPASCESAATWSEPIVISDGGTRARLPDLGFSPQGELHAVWWDGGSDNAIELDSCAASDCSASASWGADATVRTLDSFDDDGDGSADPLPARCPIIAAPSGLVGPSPSVETAPDGTVAVAFSDLRDNPDPARPSRCTASGSDKTFDSYVAVGGSPGTAPGPGGTVRVSADGPEDLNDHFLPALSVDPADGRIEVAFSSTEADPAGQQSRRLYVSSADGDQFSSPTPIATASSRYAGTDSTSLDYGARQGADSSDGVFRAAWTDNRPLQGRDSDLYVSSREADTAITSGPAGVSPSAAGRFGFATTAPRAECRLDSGLWQACATPFTTPPLRNGTHRLAVRGTDAVGNPADSTPAQRSWTVRDLTPPETLLTVKPKRVTRERKPRFEFTANEAGATFECRYDSAAWSACPRGIKSAKLTVGRHSFAARAIDVAGNVDPTPASHRFARIADCSKKAKPKKRNRCKRRNARLRSWARS
jgi:hypothetical protein